MFNMEHLQRAAFPLCEFHSEPLQERRYLRDSRQPVSRFRPADRPDTHGDPASQSGERRLVHLVVT
jgi:hypothetical protein